MGIKDEKKNILRTFLLKRKCEKHFNEILDALFSISTNSNFAYYLPAVTFVILRDKYKIAVSPAELKSENLGQVKTKFIMRARKNLSVSRNNINISKQELNKTIDKICSKLSVCELVQKNAKEMNSVILKSKDNAKDAIQEFFSYCASLVYVAYKNNEGMIVFENERFTPEDCLTQEKLSHQLNISSHFLRKYTKFITDEMARLNP